MDINVYKFKPFEMNAQYFFRQFLQVLCANNFVKSNPIFIIFFFFLLLLFCLGYRINVFHRYMLSQFSDINIVPRRISLIVTLHLPLKRTGYSVLSYKKTKQIQFALELFGVQSLFDRSTDLQHSKQGQIAVVESRLWYFKQKANTDIFQKSCCFLQCFHAMVCPSGKP